MGAYLSEPDKDTHSIDDQSTRFKYGASSMQGWRISNEDAHSCILDYDKNSALFAVYDGHGGAEVAIYTADHLPNYIKSHHLYEEGQIEKALQESFVEFDLSLREPDVSQKLLEIANKYANADTSDSEDAQPGPSGSGSTSGYKVNGTSSVVEDVDTSVLRQEAELPIDELLRKYVRDKNSSKIIPLFKNIMAKKLIPSSPMIKSAQTQKGSTSTSDSIVSETPTTGGDVAQENNSDIIAESSSEIACDKREDSSATTIKSDKIINEEPSSSTSTTKEDSTVGEDIAGEGSDKPTLGPSSSTSADHAESTRLALSLLMSSDDDDSSEGSDFDSEDLESSNDDDDDDEDDDGDDEDDDDIEDPFEAARHRLRKFKRKGAHTNKDSDDDDNENEEAADEDEEDQWEDQEEESEDEEQNKYTTTPGKDSGCTAVIALFRENTLYVANAGDSRCVVCRDGEALDMSLDHKPEDKIESDRIYQAGGKITEDGRVNGGLNLSRAIGDYAYKNNEKLSYREQMITALPDVRNCTIDPKRDSFVVLACDGIWNSMSSQDVVDFIKSRIEKTEKLSQICEEIFHHCLAKDTSGDGTGCDNMTCIIIKIDENTIHKDDLESDKQTIMKESIKRKCDEESELPKKKECV